MVVPTVSGGGYRLLFRLWGTTISVFVLFSSITPRKQCWNMSSGLLAERVRYCIRHEVGGIPCPYLHPFIQDNNNEDPSRDSPCLVYIYELIWPVLAALLLTTIYVTDLALGTRLMRRFDWTTTRQRRFYCGFMAFSAFVWISVLATMCVILIVRWPQTVQLLSIASNQTLTLPSAATNQTQSLYLRRSYPATWIGTLSCAGIMICSNIIELVMIEKAPHRYYAVGQCT